MSILFTTGTINQPDAGSVGLSMMEQLRDDIAIHPAWDLVEEFTPATSAVRWYVFKCLAAQSGLPNDFYVIFQRTLATGRLAAFIAEGYDVGTHTASLYATSNTNGNIVFDASGRASAYTQVLGTAALGTGAQPNPHSIMWAPGGTSTKYWTTVAEDGLTVAFNGSANGFMHFGKYDYLGDLPNLMPIHFFGSTSNHQFGGITRNPAVASSTNFAGALRVRTEPGGTGVPFVLGFPGRLDMSDKLLNNLRPVAECSVLVDVSFTDAATIGQFLGKSRRLRYGTSPPAGAAFGDAYVHNGNLWVPYLPTDGRIWDTGVAAV